MWALGLGGEEGALAACDLTSGTLYFSATSAIRRSCQAEMMPPRR
jgi:hypothetical protein